MHGDADRAPDRASGRGRVLLVALLVGVGSALVTFGVRTLHGEPAVNPRLLGCHGGARVGAHPGPSGVAVWSEPSMCKPWPQLLPLLRPPQAELRGAQGEAVALFVVVRAAHADSVRAARVGPLADAQGHTLPASAVATYQVGLVQLKTPSNVEGRVGEWPDPLIPAVDRYADEPRRAFPFALPAGHSRAVYVELRIPAGQPSGEYRGAVQVALGGETRALPLLVVVRGFAIPSTSSLANTFGFSGRTALVGHFGSAQNETELQVLTYRYHLAALRHRISLHGGSGDPAPWRTEQGAMRVDFAPYDREMAPFLDGTVAGEKGARFTLVDLRVPARLAGTERSAYVGRVAAHFRERGWLSRLFDYTWDEPKEEAFGRVRERALATRRGSPEVARLVTRPYTQALAGSVEIWAPVVNHVEDKAGFSREVPRDFYRPRQSRGERLFWYLSCMSHGCDAEYDRKGDPYFTGWPSYVIDAPAIAARIFPWLSFRYAMDGELYFNTVEAYGTLDPWRSSYLFAGNGDGTLFYPGRPAELGGQTHFPVESLRLKQIRDGLQDYEYLALAARLGEGALAARLAAELAPSTYTWRRDPARLSSAREELAAAIERRRAARTRAR